MNRKIFIIRDKPRESLVISKIYLTFHYLYNFLNFIFLPIVLISFAYFIWVKSNNTIDTYIIFGLLFVAYIVLLTILYLLRNQATPESAKELKGFQIFLERTKQKSESEVLKEEWTIMQIKKNNISFNKKQGYQIKLKRDHQILRFNISESCAQELKEIILIGETVIVRQVSIKLPWYGWQRESFEIRIPDKSNPKQTKYKLCSNDPYSDLLNGQKIVY